MVVDRVGMATVTGIGDLMTAGLEEEIAGRILGMKR